jgi:hypothetical protein
LLDPQGWLVISLKQTAAFSGKIWIRLDKAIEAERSGMMRWSGLWP